MTSTINRQLRKQLIMFNKSLSKVSRAAAIATLSLVGIILTGCGSGTQILTLNQPAKVVKLKPLDNDLNGYGSDVIKFDAPLKRDGKPYGAVMGTMTKVSSLGVGTRPEREDRMLTAVYDLPNGQVSVLGLSFYKKSAKLLPVGEPETRAVVGGTGAYEGVHGEVVTTHNADDSYTHVIKMTH
jgi:hypothetical protein